MADAPVSTLDWLKMCDVGIAVRQRASESGHKGLFISDEEMTVLVCAALEYANRLAHEAGERLRKAALI